MDRIDKVLSNLGLLSRNDCKKAIKQGRIKINGLICKGGEEKIDPDKDEIILDGKTINTTSYVYYMLNKPAGYVTAREDKNQPCVFDLVSDKRKNLAAVGRLDKDTTGLLLITNDGQLNHRMLSAKYHVPKRYEVIIKGKLKDEDIDRLISGIDIGDDTPTLPAQFEMLQSEYRITEGNSGDYQLVALIITEGRYHQVKRMFAAVGCEVVRLHRTDFGPLHLDNELKFAEIRELTEDEINSCIVPKSYQ